MLIGLGLGPGDPELLTLKAVRLLKTADRVFVPGGIALDLVKPYCDATVLEFPMTRDEDRISQCMESNADQIAPYATGGVVVLGILGDPNFFSTFSRLCEAVAKKYPAIAFHTEPGVSSITAFAAKAGVSIAEGFTVLDGKAPRSKILMKVKKPAETARQLKKEGYVEFVLVERMYMDGERVYRDDLPESSDYFSILFARR